MKGRVPLLMLTLAACADGPPESMSFGSSPLALTQGQALHAELFTAPQPPQRGLNEARLVLSAPDAGMLDGLTVTVTPWMPEHGHGSSVVPTVTDDGMGTWSVSDLYLAMPGTWQLRVEVQGAVNDELVPSFDIP